MTVPLMRRLQLLGDLVPALLAESVGILGVCPGWPVRPIQFLDDWMVVPLVWRRPHLGVRPVVPLVWHPRLLGVLRTVSLVWRTRFLVVRSLGLQWWHAHWPCVRPRVPLMWRPWLPGGGLVVGLACCPRLLGVRMWSVPVLACSWCRGSCFLVVSLAPGVVWDVLVSTGVLSGPVPRTHPDSYSSQ